MASIAQLPELVGFFSYSREDDEAFRGSLSALRDAIQRELSAQLGRTRRNFRLWQDQEAIAPGKDWEAEITKAIEQSVFFIPIVTPRAVGSDYCKFEFASFVAREGALGRGDLIFPIIWISVPALLDETYWHDDPVLSIVAKRQYVDWRPYRHAAVDSPAFGQAIERFCGKIVDTLREPWLSPEERVRQEAEAKRRAEERAGQEAEAKRQTEERERLRKEALAKKRAEEEAREREEAERQRQESEAKKRAEEEAREREQAERQRQESEAKKRAEDEERARQEAEAKRRAQQEGAKRRREEAETQRRLVEDAERRRQEIEAKRGTEEERREPDERTRAEVGPRRQAEGEIAQPADASEPETQEQSSRPRRPSRRDRLLAGVLVAAMAAGAAVWWGQHRLKEEVQPRTTVTAPPPPAEKEETRPPAAVTALTTAQERALKPGDSFKECADCPEMIVAPAGRFLMGSPAGQGFDSERPAHEVTIAKPFAVAKFALTFDQWDACAARGGCRPDVDDDGWGRGRRPVINVSWDDAQAYVKWLSITGKQYRLLSEAEYEYAARAGSQTKYPWGDDIKLNGEAMANCDGCGSQWDNKQTAPVGSFPANPFGLYDMVGNVWEWTEDCWNVSYQGAPADGSPWTSGDCSRRVIRGGSWLNAPDDLRSAIRHRLNSGDRPIYLGFRIARTLTP